jgi:hypothetical protein
MSFSWKISGNSTAYFSNFQDFLKKSIVGFSRKIIMTIARFPKLLEFTKLFWKM